MSSEKKQGDKKTLGGIIIGGVTSVGIIIALLNDSTDIWGKVFNNNPSKETVQQQNEVTTKTREFSNSEIEDFMKDYNRASVNALNSNKFAGVEVYLDPSGDMYKKQKKDIRENKKQVTQDESKTVFGNVKVVNSNTYKVFTYEEYEEYDKNNNGNKEIKDKNYHEYTLIVDKNNELKVSEHTMPKSKPW
ncbi:TPA: hypothetical protein QCX73_005663 [Bacillus mycoides]|nr:hypothetical protein [Bacillus mycoides]HDR7630938.1 hypothetical protein [Bacillus mycoides]